MFRLYSAATLKHQLPLAADGTAKSPTLGRWRVRPGFPRAASWAWLLAWAAGSVLLYRATVGFVLADPIGDSRHPFILPDDRVRSAGDPRVWLPRLLRPHYRPDAQLENANIVSTPANWTGLRDDDCNQIPIMQLRDKDLRYASMDGATLVRADLRGSTFNGAEMRNADLRRVNMNWDTDIPNTDTETAGSTTPDRHHAESADGDDQGDLMVRVGLRADMARAKLEAADLTGADMRDADLTKAYLKSAVLDNAWLMGAHLTGANLMKATFNKTDLTGADLTSADLNGADLTGATMTTVDFTRARFVGARLAGSKLNGVSSCAKADFTSADLTGANLAGANFTGANFGRATLAGADLTGTDLTGADLRFTKGLTQAQLDRAITDSATRVSPPLEPCQ